MAGLTVPNVLSPEWAQQVAAQGSNRLENGTADIPFHGYRGDGPLLPAPGDLPSATHKVEASKTEPDKNNAFSDDTKDLHTFGLSFTTHWVTLHDTATDPSGSAFDANGLAKAARATPFKRPEDGPVPAGHRLPRVLLR